VCKHLAYSGTTLLKARKYRIGAGDQLEQPEIIYIFVIVSNTHFITEPRAAFYVNPWAGFANGRAEVVVTQNVLSLSFHQRINNAKVPGPAYQPPPKRPWFSRVATKINHVLSLKRQPPEASMDAEDTEYCSVSGRTGLIK
jgi:hypothetical protein